MVAKEAHLHDMRPSAQQAHGDIVLLLFTQHGEGVEVEGRMPRPGACERDDSTHWLIYTVAHLRRHVHDYGPVPPQISA